jgi:hypothetical protein
MGNGVLPRQFKVVGVGRKPMTTEQYRDKISGDLRDQAVQVLVELRIGVQRERVRSPDRRHHRRQRPAEHLAW